MSNKKTTKQFIKKANKIHNNKYNYSKVVYKTNKDKVEIICKKHGSFWQKPNNHLNGQGCYKCGREIVSNKLKKTTKQFIKEANKIHNNKYDYSFVDYNQAHEKVKIICPVHGLFFQSPHCHLKGKSCKRCADEESSKKRSKSSSQFIKDAREVHGNRYDYSKTEYIRAKAKIKIICPVHGIFKQRPNDHLNGCGCPICKSSKGELKIRNFLLRNEIKFIQQKTFPDCKRAHFLPFDFYLPEHNLCIEYDGIQHFEAIEYFGGENQFKDQLIKDNIKNNYCKENDINLLRIRYDENNIIKLLENKIENVL